MYYTGNYISFEDISLFASSEGKNIPKLLVANPKVYEDTLDPIESITSYDGRYVVSPRGEDFKPSRTIVSSLFEGRDNNTGLDVFIKVMKPDFSIDKEKFDIEGMQKAMKSFAREAELLTILTGETNQLNIPRYLDFCIAHFDGYDMPTIVMEKIKGQVASRKNLSDLELLNVMLSIGTTVDFCHEITLLHRDIKPSNIMIEDVTKKPFLIDFGIADATLRGIADDFIVGSIPYLTENALRGGIRTFKDDIWAFKITLFELFAGYHPMFGGSHPKDENEMLTLLREKKYVPLISMPSVRKRYGEDSIRSLMDIDSFFIYHLFDRPDACTSCQDLVIEFSKFVKRLIEKK